VRVVGGGGGVEPPAIGANSLADCTFDPSGAMKGPRKGKGREGGEDPLIILIPCSFLTTRTLGFSQFQAQRAIARLCTWLLYTQTHVFVAGSIAAKVLRSAVGAYDCSIPCRKSLGAVSTYAPSRRGRHGDSRRR
jgi:hypothetical protein